MAVKNPTVEVRFPPKLHPAKGPSPLFDPNRYKVFYGGRGAGKSWGIARALLIKASQKKLRILCAREYMSSMQDSVWQLLSDQIVNLQLEAFYTVEKNIIRGANGSQFTFMGIRQNISNIRSVEGTDILWAEEAANISHLSWTTIIPTIRRKAKSEIIVSFNPDDVDDATWKMFVLDPPIGACVVKINWEDNPFLEPEFIDEIREFQQKYPDEYPHVYLGECRAALSGAVYGNEIRQAETDGRFCIVRYDPTGGPVEAFWDLGWADQTSIFIAQVVKTGATSEIHILDYFESEQKPLDFYLMLLNDKQKCPYPIERHWLPHDARAKSLGTGKSIEEIMRAKGHKVSIVQKLSITDGIQATRAAFGSMWFDGVKCAEGLKALRKYRYEIRDRMNKYESGLKDAPLHDRWSHAADALKYMAIALRPPKPPPDKRLPSGAWSLWRNEPSTAWMDL